MASHSQFETANKSGTLQVHLVKSRPLPWGPQENQRSSE